MRNRAASLPAWRFSYVRGIGSLKSIQASIFPCLSSAPQPRVTLDAQNIHINLRNPFDTSNYTELKLQDFISRKDVDADPNNATFKICQSIKAYSNAAIMISGLTGSYEKIETRDQDFSSSVGLSIIQPASKLALRIRKLFRFQPQPPSQSSQPESARPHSRKHHHSLLTNVTHTQSTPSQEFHPFPNLPTELRLKIWSYALSNPLSPASKNSSSMPWPPLLTTCHESRCEAIRHYEKILGPLNQFRDLGDKEVEVRTTGKRRGTVKAPRYIVR